jgi:hypothetical protein
VVARHGYGIENGMADDKHGPCLTTEQIEIRYIEADVLVSDGRIEMMEHGAPSWANKDVINFRLQ